MRALYLIRHPRPAGAEACCYGRLDLPLAEPAGHSLPQVRARLPASFQVWSSPLRRCLELALALDPQARQHPGLQELDFGDWEGRAWDDIGAPALDAWAADVTGHTPPGGESARQLLLRVQAALAEVLAASQGALALVTHAGVIRALVAQALELAGPDWLRIRPAYGQVVALDWDGQALQVPATTRRELGL